LRISRAVPASTCSRRGRKARRSSRLSKVADVRFDPRCCRWGYGKGVPRIALDAFSRNGGNADGAVFVSRTGNGSFEGHGILIYVDSLGQVHLVHISVS